MKTRAVVDRIEGKLALLELEGKGQIIWPVKFLPKGTSPGNILDIAIKKIPLLRNSRGIK